MRRGRARGPSPCLLPPSALRRPTAERGHERVEQGRASSPASRSRRPSPSIAMRGSSITSRRGSEDAMTNGISGHRSWIRAPRSSPSDLRHQHVGHHDVERVPPPSASSASLGRRGDRGRPCPSCAACAARIRRFVALSSTIRHALALEQLRVDPRRATGRASPGDEGDVERAALARDAGALDPHRPAHQLGQPLADREAQARAAVAPAGGRRRPG